MCSSDLLNFADLSWELPRKLQVSEISSLEPSLGASICADSYQALCWHYAGLFVVTREPVWPIWSYPVGVVGGDVPGIEPRWVFDGAEWIFDASPGTSVDTGVAAVEEDAAVPDAEGAGVCCGGACCVGFCCGGEVCSGYCEACDYGELLCCAMDVLSYVGELLCEIFL